MKNRNYKNTCINLINLALDKKQITLKDLALDLNINYKPLYNAARGNTKLSGEMLLRLLDYGYVNYKDIIYTLNDTRKLY